MQLGVHAALGATHLGSILRMRLPGSESGVRAPFLTPKLLAVRWAFRSVASTITVFSSPCSAARPAIIRAKMPCSWRHSNQWRLPLTSTVSNGYRAFPGLTWPHWGHDPLQLCGPYVEEASRHLNPLRLMKTMPLNTRRSSTRGLPWDLGKKGSRRAICASDSQKRSDMVTARFSNRESRSQAEINGS